MHQHDIKNSTMQRHLWFRTLIQSLLWRVTWLWGHGCVEIQIGPMSRGARVKAEGGMWFPRCAASTEATQLRSPIWIFCETYSDLVVSSVSSRCPTSTINRTWYVYLQVLHWSYRCQMGRDDQEDPICAQYVVYMDEQQFSMISQPCIPVQFLTYGPARYPTPEL